MIRSVCIVHISNSSLAITYLFKNLSVGNRQPLDAQKSLQSHPDSIVVDQAHAVVTWYARATLLGNC